MNAIGQVVKRIKSFGTEPLGLINLTDMPDGVYFINLKTSEGLHRKKLILKK